MDTIDKYYSSIEDLPIWNWNKIHEKGDFTFLRINRINSQVTSEEYKHLKELWQQIFNQYIDRFGFSEKYNTIHDKKIEIALLTNMKIQSGDRSMLTMIEVAKKELKELLAPNENKSDFYASKGVLEKFLGFQVDARKTTVIEFFSYFEMLNKERDVA